MNGLDGRKDPSRIADPGVHSRGIEPFENRQQRMHELMHKVVPRFDQKLYAMVRPVTMIAVQRIRDIAPVIRARNGGTGARSHSAIFLCAVDSKLSAFTPARASNMILSQKCTLWNAVNASAQNKSIPLANIKANPTNATGITFCQTFDTGSSRITQPSRRRSNQHSRPTESAMPSRCVPSMIGKTQIDSRIPAPTLLS